MMKRIWAILLVVFSLFSVVAHGETPIEQVELEESTILLGATQINKEYPIFIYKEGTFLFFGSIPREFVKKGYLLAEVDLLYEQLSNNIKLPKNYSSKAVFVDIKPVEGYFQVYSLKEGEIVRVLSFPEEWMDVNGITHEDFCDFLNDEIKPTKGNKYEAGITNDSILFTTGISEGILLKNSEGFVSNLNILGSLGKVYTLKGKSR